MASSVVAHTDDTPDAVRAAIGVRTSRETIAGREGNRDLGTACMDRVRPASHGEHCEHSYRSVFALFANVTPQNVRFVRLV